MREAGKLVADGAWRLLQAMAVPGTRTIDIDMASCAVRSRGATPLVQGYPGSKIPFRRSTCSR